MMNTNYGLGLDAGGTYTDAVVLDFASGQVISSRKAPTTQPDPSEGIRTALDQIDPGLLHRVSMVSLATTFATNAIVEDQGAEAGLILVGYDELPPDIPRTTRVLMIQGGHTVSGEEKFPLDVETVKGKLDAFLTGLDAVAVTAFFSVRNPEHEIRIARLIRDRHDLPVVRGHRLSMRLDAFKRATTAWWNARLIPLISNLIKASKQMLSEKGVDAPLMVVRGDGTLMSAKTALDRPVDTLLSGPAASIMGAKHLSGLKNALIVDIGGTTTDMAALTDGRVAIDPQGASVGRWKTHVEAARVRTVGIGGDSLISLNSERMLVVGPRRVIPLCMIVEQHPEILESLKTILMFIEKTPCGRVNPCSFYLNNGSAMPNNLGPGPISEYLRFKDECNWFSAWEMEHYERQGLVFRSALTPTDIRVAAGRFDLGRKEAGELGLAIFARHFGMKESDFIEAVEEEISKRLCLEAVRLVGNKNDEALSQLLNRWFQPSSNPEGGVDLDVRLSLTAPVIGAGAPAAECLPRAFKRLNTRCVLPNNYDVSVAVGAVVGMVDRTVRALIRGDNDGRFILHTEIDRQEYDSIQEAVEHGKQKLETLVLTKMKQDHVTDPLLDLAVEEKTAKTSSGDKVHLETLLRLRATGRPDVWQQIQSDSGTANNENSCHRKTG